MIKTTNFSPQLGNKLTDSLHPHTPRNETYAVRAAWPGIQLYYPPIKYIPREKRYETPAEAGERLTRYAFESEAHSVIFDLEDGCRQKAASRQFLAETLPRVRAAIPGRVAIRINAMGTAENSLDLRLIEKLNTVVDDVMLAKATEFGGISEIRDLAAVLRGLSPQLRIQPIIEHARSVKNAEAIFAEDLVEHVVFGIHDFSRSLHLQLTPENWIQELYPFICNLTVEARLAAKGIIGGVETLLLDTDPPESELMPEWLASHANANAKIIFEHARREAALGFTGKQVIHPNHVRLIRYAFQPGQEDLYRALRILSAAVEANAFLGGAIRFEDEMMDPPMFAKALQVLLRAIMLGNKDQNIAAVVAEIIEGLPEEKLPEIWPYKIR